MPGGTEYLAGMYAPACSNKPRVVDGISMARWLVAPFPCANIEERNQDQPNASNGGDSQTYQKRDKIMRWWIELLPQAEAELMDMPADIRARFLHIAELLAAFGPQQVGMPHIRSLEGKLWEIRLTGRDGLRGQSMSPALGNVLRCCTSLRKKRRRPRTRR